MRADCRSATASLSLDGCASREACRRAAAFTGQLAEHHTKPASRGARRATAATPHPTCFPSSGPAPCGRGMGSRGTTPCASREACRRAAAFSTQLSYSTTRPASRGTRRATAVKPRPTRFPSSGPAPIGRVWGAGGHPLPALPCVIGSPCRRGCLRPWAHGNSWR